MNNRARMIERARRMYPKKKKLLEILARIDFAALNKALVQVAKTFTKMCNAYVGYAKTVSIDALKKVIDENYPDCSSAVRVNVKEDKR